MGSKKQDDRVRDIVTTASVIGNVLPYTYCGGKIGVCSISEENFHCTGMAFLTGHTEWSDTILHGRKDKICNIHKLCCLLLLVIICQSHTSYVRVSK